MRKHRFRLMRTELCPTRDGNWKDAGLYKCEHCETTRHLHPWELREIEIALAKCSSSPIKAGWWELAKGKIDCAYDAKDQK